MSNPDPALLTMIANYPSKTGKSLEEWVKIAKASGRSKHGEIVRPAAQGRRARGQA